jgi:hypothetical protein
MTRENWEMLMTRKYETDMPQTLLFSNFFRENTEILFEVDEEFFPPPPLRQH